MNFSKEQVEELLALMEYVGLETWGQLEQELNDRASKMSAVLREALEDY